MHFETSVDNKKLILFGNQYESSFPKLFKEISFMSGNNQKMNLYQYEKDQTEDLDFTTAYHI